MSNLYLSLARKGLDAAKPTTPSLSTEAPETAPTYFATDTNILYVWNGTAWTSEATASLLTAAGATQGSATPITTHFAIVTVALTVSTKGVVLPAAATGKQVVVANAATFGFKVYPAAGQKIAAASTNGADTTLAINKANRYIGVSLTKWVVLRGA